MKNFIIKETQKLSTGFGPCIKQPVYAMLRTKSGLDFFGSNEMNTSPGSTCPRDDLGYKTGEGYALCKSACSQDSHAEIECIKRAIKQNICTIDSTLFLIGHYYCCENCMGFMLKNGVKTVIFLDDDRQEEIS